MTIGKISEFDVRNDSWKLYIDRLDQYFVVNDIKSELWVPTLITVMGGEAYELLVNICTPEKPNTKTYAQLTQLMEGHLQPKASPLAERFKFRNRKQKEGEHIAEYVAELKKMSRSCDFKSGLAESLRDQLVCGISSETIRQRLFAEEDLDFNKAYKMAVSMEAAEKDAAMIEKNQGISSNAVQCQSIGVNKGRRGVSGMNGSRGQGGGGGAALAALGSGQRGGFARENRQQIGSRSGGQGLQDKLCRACGKPHETTTCKFLKYVCRVCNRKGHLGRMCPNLTESQGVHWAYSEDNVEDCRKPDSESSDEVIVMDNYKVSVDQCSPILVKLEIQGKKVSMECDTGSAVSCISQDMYNNLFTECKLMPSKIVLRYYTGELMRPVGVITVTVKYRDKVKDLDLYVIDGGKTALLGRQWLSELKIEVFNFPCNLNSAMEVFNLAKFSSRFCNVFEEGLGCFTGGPVSIHVREGATPVFLRARPLAYALREPVERALEQLVRDGVLTPVERSDWATPIVPVVKKDGNIRICADYKLTLNKVIEIDRYPLPKVEDLLTRLHGGDRFSKIDLSQAYAQLVLDESKKYTVINTHKGLYMYNRLVFGLSSSPGIFQRRLEQLFADIPQVGVFLDDIIITGKDDKEHILNLYKVFDRLQNYGLRVRKEKCEFFSKSIRYLGHVISKQGVHTCPDKVKAIQETPQPSNVSELRAFIGMIMYYGKFVKNLSTILAPLYNLLKTGVKFIWSEDCQKAFLKVKQLLASSEVLTHYSAELPVVLTVDASSVGVGAVLSQLTAEGERPVAYASRALSAAERAYSQIDREALAIVYGIKKYHQYVYGRKFILRTDHKPLTYILGSKAGIPVMAASRLQRWAVLLSGYTYDIEYVASKKNCADALSRLPPPLATERQQKKEITYVNFVENFLPVTNSDVSTATGRDATLSRVLLYIQSGWPSNCPTDEMKPYYQKKNELYVESNCVMWGYRMVVPTELRQLVLKQLHNSHLGIVKMKGMARSYVWWPGIDADVEAECRRCETCALEADAPPRAPPAPWPYHPEPWSRIHLDFLAINGKTYLVLIDSSTKWLEVIEMMRTTALNVIKVLRSIFARFGLPMEIVSDQGPPFTSAEFQQFLRQNGVQQRFSPAYHPASNGAAENAVKLCKRALKKAYRDKVDVEAALQTFLLSYRNTVQCTTGQSPAMLLQKRTLRNRLDLLRGSRRVLDHTRAEQSRQAAAAGGMYREVEPGEPVWYRSYGAQAKWQKGTVIEGDGSRQYIIRGNGSNDRFIKKHIDQIRRRSRLSDVSCPVAQSERPMEAEAQPSPKVRTVSPKIVREVARGDEVPVREKETLSEQPASVVSQQPAPVVSQQPPPSSPYVPSPSRPVERPNRVLKPVLRYGFEID